MVDLSKHLARAKQAIDKRSYDLALEVCTECQELDPANIDLYRVLVDAAKRKAKEKGGKGGLFGLTVRMPAMSSDPQKQLSAAVKAVAKAPDLKSLAGAGDAALKLVQGGTKAMASVAIYFYEECRATGLFNAEVLFNVANLYYDQFRETKNGDFLDKALKTVTELERAKPDHPTAGKLVRDWNAAVSMQVRETKTTSGSDFTSQVANASSSRKAEVMNRMIRTWDDAKETLAFIEADLKENSQDKHLWIKKGDIHRRFQQFAEAKSAFAKAVEVDPHDFTVTMRLGDVRMEEAKGEVTNLEQAGVDASAAKQALQQVEIEEYRTRVDRQPTETEHRFNLGRILFAAGQIEAAASEFQRTVQDPRRKRESHIYLGQCFTKKGLADLAIQQYESYLKMLENDSGDQAKGVRYARARLAEQSGKKALAITDYTRLVELDLGFKDAAQRLSALQAVG